MKKALKIFISLFLVLNFNSYTKIDANNNDIVQPYALVSEILVDTTQREVVEIITEAGTFYADLECRVFGSYLSKKSGTNIIIENIDISASLSRIATNLTNPLPSYYTPYIKSMSRSQSGNKLKIVLTIAFNYLSTIDLYVYPPITFTFYV